MASEASRLHLLIRDAGLSVPQQLPDPVVTDFSCDSRRIRPGTLFVGLPGERVDGGSFCRAALQRLGFASAGEIANYWETVSNPEAQEWCRAQLGNGLREIEIECADSEKPRTVYAFDDITETLEAVPEPLPILRILSPFDPMIRDRQRAKRLFGFDYRIEIFVPEHKRQYGYYVFPILEGDRFVARIDMKHRRQEDGSLHVTGLWPERGVKFGKARRRALDAALEQMRRFCGAETVSFADGYFREGA